MLYITKHARMRLSERYNVEPWEIDQTELYALLEENVRYGITKYNDTVQVTFFYKGELLKSVYNPKEKVLVTVNPINDEKQLKLDRTNHISRH